MIPSEVLSQLRLGLETSARVITYLGYKHYNVRVHLIPCSALVHNPMS